MSRIKDYLQEKEDIIQALLVNHSPIPNNLIPELLEPFAAWGMPGLMLINILQTIKKQRNVRIQNAPKPQPKDVAHIKKVLKDYELNVGIEYDQFARTFIHDKSVGQERDAVWLNFRYVGLQKKLEAILGQMPDLYFEITFSDPTPAKICTDVSLGHMSILDIADLREVKRLCDEYWAGGVNTWLQLRSSFA